MEPKPQPYCNATLNYASGAGVTPAQVTVHNGRSQPDLKWQQQGFECLSHRSAIADWDNDSDIEDIHYAEITELAKSLSGSHSVIVSGHISRNSDTAAKHSDYAPIEFVHSDFTDNYGERIKQRYAQGLDIEVRALERAGVSLEALQSAEHLLILQFWRNVGAAQPDRPLAFCDAQSVPRSNLRAFNVESYAGGDFAFDTFAVQAPDPANPHVWYTFPEMNEEEVVAFRTYDSRLIGSGKPFWTPHSAFRNPLAPVDAPARRSIELRATCLF